MISPPQQNVSRKLDSRQTRLHGAAVVSLCLALFSGTAGAAPQTDTQAPAQTDVQTEEVSAPVAAVDAITTPPANAAGVPADSPLESAAAEPTPESVPSRVADPAPGPAGHDNHPDQVPLSIPDFAVSEGDWLERQIEVGELDPAINSLERQIRLIERESHRYDERLIRPLTLLGDAQFAKGDTESALDAFDRAIHVARVSHGLHNAEQVPIVYREARVLKVQRDLEGANNREEYAYEIMQRHYGPDDPALLPSIYHLADWYMSTHNLFQARALFYQAKYITEMEGVNSADADFDNRQLITPLEGVARTYVLERFPPFYIDDGTSPYNAFPTASGGTTQIRINNFPAGERALKQIVQIRQDHREEQPLAFIDALVNLADWYLLFDKPRTAMELYAHAHNELATIEGVDSSVYFSHPQLLHFPKPAVPKRHSRTTEANAANGFVELTYQISDLGTVRQLNVVASEPKGLMDVKVRKSLRRSRYRPRFVDGVAVPVDEHSYRYEFTYKSERNEQEAEQSDNETVSAADPERGSSAADAAATGDDTATNAEVTGESTPSPPQPAGGQAGHET